jgi:hypothetical protein
MRLLIASIFAFSSAAFAAHIAPVSYHEGTLVSFSMPASESKSASSPEQTCSDANRAQYIVKSKGILYAVTPVSSATGRHCRKSNARLGQSFQQELFAVSPAAWNSSPASR